MDIQQILTEKIHNKYYEEQEALMIKDKDKFKIE